MAVSLRVTFPLALPGLISALNAVGGNGAQKLKATLYGEAELIMAESKTLCPVDTGALRSSGHVERPEVQGDSASVEMAYGGPAAPYALYVHEDLSKYHQAPTKAKFLEEPTLAHLPDLKDAITASFSRAIRKALEGA